MKDNGITDDSKRLLVDGVDPVPGDLDVALVKLAELLEGSASEIDMAGRLWRVLDDVRSSVGKGKTYAAWACVDDGGNDLLSSTNTLDAFSCPIVRYHWVEAHRWGRELTAEGVLVGVSVVVLHHDVLGDGNDILIVGVLLAARSHTSVVESGLTSGDVGFRTDTNRIVSYWPRNHAWCQKKIRLRLGGTYTTCVISSSTMGVGVTTVAVYVLGSGALVVIAGLGVLVGGV